MMFAFLFQACIALLWFTFLYITGGWDVVLFNIPFYLFGLIIGSIIANVYLERN